VLLALDSTVSAEQLPSATRKTTPKTRTVHTFPTLSAPTTPRKAVHSQHGFLQTLKHPKPHPPVSSQPLNPPARAPVQVPTAVVAVAWVISGVILVAQHKHPPHKQLVSVVEEVVLHPLLFPCTARHLVHLSHRPRHSCMLNPIRLLQPARDHYLVNGQDRINLRELVKTGLVRDLHRKDFGLDCRAVGLQVRMLILVCGSRLVDRVLGGDGRFIVVDYIVA